MFFLCISEQNKDLELLLLLWIKEHVTSSYTKKDAEKLFGVKRMK